MQVYPQCFRKLREIWDTLLSAQFPVGLNRRQLSTASRPALDDPGRDSKSMHQLKHCKVPGRSEPAPD